MPKTPREPRQSDHLFALRLDQLFETHLDPTGKPYSVRQVAAHTGMSASYLSGLRRGKLTGPGADKVAALARFFGVEMAYFMGSERVELPAVTAGDDRLRKALENPLVREIAITTGDFNREQWDHMLAIFAQRTEKVKVRMSGSAGPSRPLRRGPRHDGSSVRKVYFQHSASTWPHLVRVSPGMRADPVAKIIMRIVCRGAGFLHSTVIAQDEGQEAHPLGAFYLFGAWAKIAKQPRDLGGGGGLRS